MVFSVMFGVDTGASASLSTKDDCNVCLDGMGGGGPGHSFQSGGDGSFMGSHVNFTAGTCAGNHSSCNGDLPTDSLSLVAMDGIVESGDVLLIAATMQQAPGKIRFNESRRALQLFGCDGIIVANIPVGFRNFAD